jgi:hypothetical protein
MTATAIAMTIVISNKAPRAVGFRFRSTTVTGQFLWNALHWPRNPLCNFDEINI